MLVSFGSAEKKLLGLGWDVTLFSLEELGLHSELLGLVIWDVSGE